MEPSNESIVEGKVASLTCPMLLGEVGMGTAASKSFFETRLGFLPAAFFPFFFPAWFNHVETISLQYCATLKIVKTLWIPAPALIENSESASEG